MLHLPGKALDGHYQGLKENPLGVTVLSLNIGIPPFPAVRSLVPPNEVLWWPGVSVSMASQTQTAWEIRDGTRPWFSADPHLSATNKHPGQTATPAPGPYGPGQVLMKQLNSRWAGNLLIATCQSSSKYPTCTLYSIIGYRRRRRRWQGTSVAHFSYMSLLFFFPSQLLVFNFCSLVFSGMFVSWCHSLIKHTWNGLYKL